MREGENLAEEEDSDTEEKDANSGTIHQDQGCGLDIVYPPRRFGFNELKHNITAKIVPAIKT